MSNQQITRKQWVEEQRARQESTALRTRDEWMLHEATRKVESKIKKSVNRTIASLSILDKLRQLREQSAKESLSMLVVTPLNGKKQTVILLEKDWKAQMPAIEEYFTTLLEANAEAKEIGMKAIYPSVQYRMDVYISGKELQVANYGFATLSVKTLPNLGKTLALANKLGAIAAPVSHSDVNRLKFNDVELAEIEQQVSTELN